MSVNGKSDKMYYIAKRSFWDLNNANAHVRAGQIVETDEDYARQMGRRLLEPLKKKPRNFDDSKVVKIKATKVEPKISERPRRTKEA